MAQKGDFIGFTFNGVHSSELGIVRTSDGSRFSTNLLPTIQDKTVQVPGGDGTYFFGSYYTQKPFNISFATDEVTEEQFHQITTLFGDKQIHDLIFDETPYKVYSAKCTGNPQFKFICFEEEDSNGKIKRIYKGEGTLNFTCYYPYARSRFNYLDEYTSVTIPEWRDWIGTTSDGNLYAPGVAEINSNGNKDEWAAASRMQPTQGKYDQLGENQVSVFNAGDFECDFKIYFNQSISELSLNDNTFKMQSFDLEGGDAYFCINSASNLIEGCDEEFNPTGTLYNKYIIAGDFFKLPLGESIIQTNKPIQKIEYTFIYI